MNPFTVVLLALVPFVAFPCLVAAALGVRMPRPKLSGRNILLFALALYASLYAYVGADEKNPQPPEPPEPPPGPYIPGGVWEVKLHRNPMNGSLEWRREYRLPPSAPEIEIVVENQ